MRTIGAEFTSSNVAYLGGISTYCNIAPSNGSMILSGKLGIGVSNPSYALEVSNPSLFQSNVTIRGSLMQEVGSQKLYSSSGGQYGVPSGYVMENASQGVGLTLRQSDSNVQGYTSLVGSNGGLSIISYNASTSNASYTYISSSGSLGINTQTPTEKLAVDGSIKATSNVYAMQKLGVGVSNSQYTAHVQGTLYAQTYCNLLVDSYQNTSTSNAPTSAALKATYDKIVAFSNSVAVNDTLLFSSNTAASASNTAIWTSNNAFIKSQGGTIDNQVTINSNLNVLSNLNVYQRLFASNILVAGDILPTANEVFDLGSSNTRFRDLYLSGNSIDLGGLRIRKNFGVRGGVSFTDINNETVPTVSSKLTLSNSGEISLYTSNNSLGVNNSNPTATLDVTGDAAISGNLRLQGAFASSKPLSATGLFVLKNSNITVGRTSIAAAVQNIDIGPSGMSLYIVGSTSNDAFRFVSATTQEIATLTGNGNLGIGAKTPSHRLTVTPSNYEPKVCLYGSNVASFYGMGVSSNQLNVHIPNSNASFMVMQSGSNGDGKELFQVKGDGTFAFYNRDSNNLVIDLIRGTGASGQDRNADWRIQSTSNGHLVYSRLTSNEFVNAEVLRFNPLGYIGISNVNPRASLDVQGTFSTNNTHVRKDFTYQSAASNTWTQKLYLGEFAAGSTSHIHITSLGSSATSPYTFEVQKSVGSNSMPIVHRSTQNDPFGISRARLYWSKGSTDPNNYYHMWFDWYDIGTSDTLYATMDVYGAASSSLPWTSTEEPVIASSQTPTPTLNLTTSNYVGISYSNPQHTLHVGGKAAFNTVFGYYVPRTTVSSINPNIWMVAGENNTRIGNYAVTLGGNILTEVINGKYGWRIGDQNAYVDVPYTISSTSTTWTIAIAIAAPPLVINTYGVLFAQIVSDSDANLNANHQLAIDADFRSLGVDEQQPTGGSYTFTNALPPSGLHGQSVLIFRRNTTSSLSVWYNNIKLGETATFTETYIGANPTRMRLGSRSLNVSSRSPVGMAFAGLAVWDAALTDAQITTLTYDALTAL